MPAVGGGQRVAMLERDLGFGMHVGRINVTRRQFRIEDKRLSQELSSGDNARFCAAMERLIERGAIRRGGINEAVPEIFGHRKGGKQVESVVVCAALLAAGQIFWEIHYGSQRGRAARAMA